jgi:GAF domain-containing protein
VDPTEHPSTVDEPLSELAANVSETIRILFAAGSVPDTLARVVGLAVATIEGCDVAGLFVVEDGEVTSPASTDPVADEVDTLQHEIGEGPCLDAIAERAIIYADDLAHDPRWPHFGARAAMAGVRSALALPLVAETTPGSLNLYARYPAAFGAVDRARGVLLASMASVALSSAHTHEDEERRSDNLHAALDTREVIGQAQGILMERERISADQAFDILRRASQHLNLKLREVAQNLVDTGERPETGPPTTA